MSELQLTVRRSISSASLLQRDREIRDEPELSCRHDGKLLGEEKKMKQPGLEDLQDAINRRGEPGDTPSGAFLEYLRNVAKALDIGNFAESCSLYFASHPESAGFISARVPAILSSSYFRALPDFDFEKFTRWQAATPDWAGDLKEGVDSPSALADAIAVVHAEVKAFSR